jgi:hypothetical protein
METKTIAEVWKWEQADKPVAVEFDLRVIDGLGAEVVRGLGAVPRRGVEVGGVLLGSVAPGTPAVVTVRQYEPVAIEYLHGPQYRFSDKDRENFRVAMARLRHQGPDVQPVGFYRSETGDAFVLTEEDRAILTEFFPKPEDVCLVVRPAVLKAPSAVLILKENGEFPAEITAEPFAFRRRELTGGASEKPQGEWNRHAHQHPEAARPAEVVPPPVPVQQPLLPMTDAPEVETPAPVLLAPEEPPRSRIRLALAVLLLALLALGATAGDWYARTHTPPVSAATLLAQDPYELGLSGERRDGSVLLRWDRNAKVLRTAERGSLTISEGDRSKTIPLDASQLQNGSVLYRHVAPEIRFRLEVETAANRTLAESLVWHQPAK